jgi:sec-independent protein translocase protein TatA
MVLANIFGLTNPWDVAIIAGVVILLFGGAKLPGFMKSLGDGMKEFKKATNEISAGDSPATAPQPVLEASAKPAGAATQTSEGTPSTASEPSTK